MFNRKEISSLTLKVDELIILLSETNSRLSKVKTETDTKILKLEVAISELKDARRPRILSNRKG